MGCGAGSLAACVRTSLERFGEYFSILPNRGKGRTALGVGGKLDLLLSADIKSGLVWKRARLGDRRQMSFRVKMFGRRPVHGGPFSLTPVGAGCFWQLHCRILLPVSSHTNRFHVRCCFLRSLCPFPCVYATAIPRQSVRVSLAPLIFASLWQHDRLRLEAQ